MEQLHLRDVVPILEVQNVVEVLVVVSMDGVMELREQRVVIVMIIRLSVYVGTQGGKYDGTTTPPDVVPILEVQNV